MNKGKIISQHSGNAFGQKFCLVYARDDKKNMWINGGIGKTPIFSTGEIVDLNFPWSKYEDYLEHADFLLISSIEAGFEKAIELVKASQKACVCTATELSSTGHRFDCPYTR